MTKLVVGLGPHPQKAHVRHLFDCFVARQDCVIDLAALRAHPNVKHVLSLPRDWVLYEFHHRLFADPEFLEEGVWYKKMDRFPALRQERIAMLDQQRALLGPWYAKKQRLGDAGAVAASHICIYRFCSLNPMRWIDFVPADNWGASPAFSLEIESEADELSSNASQLIKDWLGCGDLASELKVSAGPETKAGTLGLRLECTSYSGHWLAGLWALLSDARLKTRVKRMQVTDAK